MANLSLAQAIDIARTLRRHGLEIDEVLRNPAIPPAFHDEVRDALSPRIIIDAERRASETAGRWVERLKPEEWYYWPRLESYLRVSKGWDGDVVDSISEWSLHILRRMADPTMGSFRCRGLVVGYVQSGKTANYSAVAARAADAGYKLIIILSGIHNSLRAQTQFRLDQELTGNVREGVPSVERGEHGRQWKTLTGLEDDFQDTLRPGFLQGDQPILAVVKKNCSVLERLIRQLRDAGRDARNATPTLIIDDEADQASVNTRGNRGDEAPALAVADEGIDPDLTERDVAEDPETAPSRTNALIRELIGMLPRCTYIGYTATPFANVLIDPDAFDREYGEGLFPRDFILQLPRPRGYSGTEELFGLPAGEGRDVLRFIPDEEARALRPRHAELDTFEPGVEPSLRQAFLDFVLAGAVRLWRGQNTSPNTMLVHTSHYTDAQTPLRAALDDLVTAFRGEWNFGGAGSRIRQDLLDRWNSDIAAHLDVPSGDTPPSFEDIAAFVGRVAERLEVLELNSAAGHELNYRSGEPIQVIAVGGNRLSRGLTLEGLTVSYFIRTSGMCDTLLQMGRWFGYRAGYEDLIRIYTTMELASWFAELALIEADLRDEIDRMNEAGMSPEEQGVRIRTHSSMLLTSRLKMRHGTQIPIGYSAAHPQTIVFPLDDVGAMNENAALAAELVSRGRIENTEGGGILVQDISPDDVLAFLESYQHAPETRTLDPEHLCRWIRRRVADGEMSRWTVFLASPPSVRHGNVRLGSVDIGMVNRSRIPGTHSIGTLLDPKHEAVDLPGGAENFRRPSGTYDSKAMREARPREAGLLLLYAISPDSEPERPGNRTTLFVDGAPRPEAVIGFGLSFPKTADDDAVPYVVGQTWADLHR